MMTWSVTVTAVAPATSEAVIPGIWDATRSVTSFP